MLLLPRQGGKEASGLAKVPRVPCLALGGSFVLARLERGLRPGSPDVGVSGEGETRGEARRADALRRACSPPFPVPPVGDPIQPTRTSRAGRNAPIVSRPGLPADIRPKDTRTREGFQTGRLETLQNWS